MKRTSAGGASARTGLPVADLVRRELVCTADGPYLQEWYCPVPGDDDNYIVLAEDWHAGTITVRRIYQTGQPPPAGRGPVSGG